MIDYMREILSETFSPEQIQVLWGLSQNEWRTLQQRKLVDSSEKPHGTTKRTVMSIVQAISLGMQMALVKEIGLSYGDAHNLVREASTEVEQLFLAPEPARRALLYAVAKQGPNGKPVWMRITPDSLVTTVDSTLGGAWVVLDVVYYVNKVCDEIALRDPKYKTWLARKLARDN